MTGLVGGLLVAGAGLWLGWSRCRWYQARSRTLARFRSDLARMSAELRERETDTEQLLALLAGSGGLPGLYEGCLAALRSGAEQPLSQLWSRAVAGQRLPLRPEELLLVEQVGQILGRYTGREQAILLDGLSRALEERDREARTESREQGRTAVVAGLALGLMLALVLA